MYHSITVETNGKKTSYIVTEYEWIWKCDVPFLWAKVNNPPFPFTEYYIPLNKVDSLSIQKV